MKNDYYWIAITLFLIFTTEPVSTLGQIGKFIAGAGIFIYFTSEAVGMYRNRKQ